MQSKQQETTNLNFLSEPQQYFQPRVLLSHSGKGKSKGHKADKARVQSQQSKHTKYTEGPESSTSKIPDPLYKM